MQRRSITHGGKGHPQEGQIISDETFEIPSVPLTLSASTFQDTCETGLGGGATGRAAYGAIVKAMRASTDDDVVAVYERLQKSFLFDKNKASPLFTLLVNKTLMTATQRTNILAAWPEGEV